MERWKGLAIGGVNLMGKHTVAIRQNQGVRAKKSIKGFILNYSSAANNKDCKHLYIFDII